MKERKKKKNEKMKKKNEKEKKKVLVIVSKKSHIDTKLTARSITKRLLRITSF